MNIIVKLRNNNIIITQKFFNEPEADIFVFYNYHYTIRINKYA